MQGAIDSDGGLADHRRVNEVGVMPARAIVELAGKAGLRLDELCRGLLFDASSLRGRRGGRVAWDDYLTLLERTEAALGGPERLDALILASFHTVLPAELRAVLRTLVSAKTLCRFIIKTVDPPMFPNQDFGYEELSGRRVRVSLRLRPPARPSRTFYRTSAAGIAGMPCHLGLPAAETEVEELTNHSLVVVMRLPRSETLVARAGRASLPALSRAALKLVGVFADDAREGNERLAELLSSRPEEPEPDLLGRVQGFEAAFALTSRQTEVLALLSRGFSNKEIASELVCAESTVEFHVSQLLRKAGADSRAQLIVKLWAR